MHSCVIDNTANFPEKEIEYFGNPWVFSSVLSKFEMRMRQNVHFLHEVHEKAEKA